MGVTNLEPSKAIGVYIGGGLELPADVIIPAATQDVIDADLAARIDCKVLVEGANLPTNADAQSVLAARGIGVVPDIVANAGGVVAAAFAMDARLSAFKPDRQQILDMITAKLRPNTLLGPTRRTRIPLPTRPPGSSPADSPSRHPGGRMIDDREQRMRVTEHRPEGDEHSHTDDRSRPSCRGAGTTRCRVVFGLPGVHNLPIWKALSRSHIIRLVGVRHEQAAAYAADGYARASGKLGVALVTTGPGAANTLGATGEAMASSSPVIAIATDIPTTLRREGIYRGVLHETRDQAAMFKPVTKSARTVATAAEVAPAVRQAAALALQANSGPVYLGIPTDLLSELAGEPVAVLPVPPADESRAGLMISTKPAS